MRTRSKRLPVVVEPPAVVNKPEEEENEMVEEVETAAPTEEENVTKTEDESEMDTSGPVLPPSTDSESTNKSAYIDLASIFDAFGIEKTHEVFDKTLRQFDVVKQQCNMEEPQKTWLACCLYTTSWASSAVTMKPGVQFSVTGLVDICELSVMEFFDKLERWALLMNASSRMVDHIERAQGNLSVSIVVFNKFLPIFRQIFVPNQEATLDDPEDPDQKISLTTFKIYEYIWVTYCAFKKQLQKANEDLMNSFHLLLIVTDLILCDLIAHDLMQFLQKSFLTDLSQSDKTILDYYCDFYNGVSLDAKHFRSHWFNAQAKTLYETEFIRFNPETYMGFLDNIDYNSEYLNTIYEEAIYERLEIDERVFVTRIEPQMLFDDTVDFGVVTNIRPIPDGSFSRNRDLLSRKASELSLTKVNTSRCIKTPLSGRAYLASSDVVCPVQENIEMSRHQKLMLLVENHDDHMNEIYDDIMKKFDGEIATAVDTTLNRLNDELTAKVNTEKEKDPNFDVAFTHELENHLQTIYQLLVRFLHRITLAEHQRLMNVATTIECLAGVFQRPEFITSIYICCLEIVIFSYQSKREFPWSLEFGAIPAISFYKVIEPVIRCDGDLSRDILKHLSKIEERVLEELAWDRTSPLWKTLADGSKIPSYEEVMIPDKNGEPVTPRSMAPLQANVLTRYGIGIPGRGNAKRRLDYSDDGDFEPAPKRAAIKAKTNNSLFLFARKVYYLAALHLNDLCDRVRMEEKARRKAWTLFEHIIRNEADLMRGRHIDQNIMCCLYIISKVSSLNLPFHEILYHYRHQPQAVSRIYRNVLIAYSNSPAPTTATTATTVDDGASRDSVSSVSQQSATNVSTAAVMRSGSTMPAPGMTSAPPTPEPPTAEYNDLITYYNRVFVKKVENFVKKLAFPEESNTRIPLLSVPTVRCNTLSPRRTITPTLIVTPLGTTQQPSSPSRPMRFNVNRSPSKDLHHINAVVRQSAQPYRIAPFQ
uniref:Uncharacterized protein n=1 Tax=Panagrolaimus sp. PS1159 TaxID=55785 RepID=A0AC35GJ27_9BILA